MDEELEKAKVSILIGAKERGEVHFFDADSGDFVESGGYSYDDNNKQRVIYIEALKQLVRIGFLEQKSKFLFELTYSGVKEAERLSLEGFVQDCPNP